MQGNGKLAPSPIRLPQDLKDWLKHRAIDNRRSFNSEVVARLEESRSREEAPYVEAPPPDWRL
ncbi:Arc family DNA-binding protein [Alicycliphilus denitrificans]|uniref:Arc family DNA-binding protein n=1 Tax=Alicycliphilus denitrificans TaxID=179636 RepID=UPI00384E4105